MALTLDKLTTMANGIARFFRPYGHDEAVAGIAAHIEAFWTPGMRDALAAVEGVDLDPLAAEALRLTGLHGSAATPDDPADVN